MSKNLDFPIFSIDYRLAPTYKYPNSLEDCVTGLFWIFVS